MPVGGAAPLPVDDEGEAQAQASMDVSPGIAYRSAFAQSFNPAGALHLINRLGEGEFQSERASMGLDAYTPPTIDAEEANQQYGVPGYLRFNAPTTPYEAAFSQHMAQQKRFNETVLSRSNANPLLTMGASLAGGLVNPANIGLMAATDGFGDFAMGATGVRGLIDSGLVSSRVGRAALNVVGEGAFAQVPFVAQNAAQAADQGDDYTAGDALRDISIGAILHTGLHYGGRLLARGVRGAPAGDTGLGADADAAMGGDVETPPQGAPLAPEEPTRPDQWAPPSGVPEAVQDLPPVSRQGALAKAVDDMANDRPVDVGQYVDRELNPPDLAKLDETTAAPAMDSWRPLDNDTAVTPRGTEVPVQYGLVEMGDLVTSHDDNLSPNPDYPQELQPRDRERAGAQARNLQLESELNPKLLMNDVSAGAGTPIVAPDGVVESGNGRAIALRRSAARGTPAYDRYRAELAARGYDTTGMDKPVLVRMRTQPLEGGARAALTREMNADVTERMSATEQARQDAGRISDADFDLIGPNEGPTTSRDFARAFVAKVAPDQVNTLVGADGALSPEGARRIKAAVLHRAYGDPKLVGQILEGDETPARKLGEALADAAPRWAQMRALAARGDIPPEMDLTPALQSAMDLVRHAAQEKIGLGELLAERLGQKELFGGEAISPFTEAFLRLFYKDGEFKRPEDPGKIAWALRDYVRQAKDVTPGEDLFGGRADENTARAILKGVAERFARGDAGDIDTVRAPGQSKPGAEPAKPVVVDLRRPVETGDGGRGGLSQPGEQQPGGAGGRPVPSRERVVGGKTVQFHDPAQASLYDLGHKLNRIARDKASKEELPADEVKAMAQSVGPYLDFTDTPGAKGEATYEGDSRVPTEKAMVRFARAFAKDLDKDPAAASLSVYDPDEAPAIAGRELEPVPIKGEPSGDLGGPGDDQGGGPAGEKPADGGGSGGDGRADRQGADGAGPGDAGERVGQAEGGSGGDVRSGDLARPPRPTGDQLIAADPELKALADDTARLMAENGIEPEPVPETQNPNTLADAIHAAAVCLAEEAG